MITRADIAKQAIKEKIRYAKLSEQLLMKKFVDYTDIANIKRISIDFDADVLGETIIDIKYYDKSPKKIVAIPYSTLREYIPIILEDDRYFYFGTFPKHRCWS